MKSQVPWTFGLVVVGFLHIGNVVPAGLPTVRVLSVPVPGLLDVSGSIFTGFIPEVLAAITTQSGNTLTFRFVTPIGTDFGRPLPSGSFNGVVGQLLAGAGDLIAAGMENHTAYQNVTALTTPLYMSNIQTIYPVKTGSLAALMPQDPVAAATLQKYVPYTIVLENSATRDFLEKSGLPENKILWGNITVAQAQAMIPHNYTAAVNCVTKTYCKFVGRTPAIDNTVTNSGGWILKEPKIIRTVTASFAVSKTNYNLLGQVNSAIQGLQYSGAIQVIWKKYFPSSPFVMPPLH